MCRSSTPTVATSGRCPPTTSWTPLAADDPADIVGLTADSVPVSEGTPVGEVLTRLDRGAGAVPVAGPDHILVGWVRHRDILRALSSAPRALSRGRPVTTRHACPLPVLPIGAP